MTESSKSPTEIVVSQIVVVVGSIDTNGSYIDGVLVVWLGGEILGLFDGKNITGDSESGADGALDGPDDGMLEGTISVFVGDNVWVGCSVLVGIADGTKVGNVVGDGSRSPKATRSDGDSNDNIQSL